MAASLSGAPATVLASSVSLPTADIPVVAPPAFFVLGAALLAPFLSRRVGHALGFGAAGMVAIWSLLMPAGT